MQVVVKDRNVDLPNTSDSIAEIEQLVNAEIKASSNEYFSHFIIDGQEVYEQYGIHIEDNLANITTVEAVFKSLETFVNETMGSLHEYLNRAIPEIRNVAEELSVGNGLKDGKLVSVIEGLQWINGAIATLAQVEGNDDAMELVEIDTTIQSFYPDVEEAIKAEDTVLIADLLQYEIVPLLEELVKKIGERHAKH